MYGNDWDNISTIVTTRTFTQMKTHAQKYHAKNNTDIQQKYQECLLPDTKIDIQKKRYCRSPKMPTISLTRAVSPLINLEMQHDGRSARIWMKRV